MTLTNTTDAFRSTLGTQHSRSEAEGLARVPSRTTMTFALMRCI